MGMLEQTVKYVKSKHIGEASGHDWWHIYRVWKTAKTIASNYDHIDRMVVECSALLHDIADWKDHHGDFEKGPKLAEAWLIRFDELSTEQIAHIQHIIRHVSFKGEKAEEIELSLEGKIVQDADRLDAIGAIGIARTFAFGGNRGAVLYDPEKPFQKDMNEQAYVHGNIGPTINHFYEKLLLLKNRMNTPWGLKMAEERHLFMENYLTQFYQEWEGEK